jgi:phage terminase large subunit-like protein
VPLKISIWVTILQLKIICPSGIVTHLLWFGTNKFRDLKLDYLWCDELAKWQFIEETVDNLLMGLRLGPNTLHGNLYSQTNKVLDGT